MAKRIVRGSVTVKRPDPKDESKGIRVVPEIGKEFDFTADEIKDFDRISPGALVKLNATDEDEPHTPAEPAEAKASKQAPKADAPKKPAPKADDEDL